jgi:RHS repeat-associated protein
MKNNNLGWIRGGAWFVIKKLAALETKTLLIVVAVLAARLVCSHAQSVLLASVAASLNVTVPTQSDALGGNQLPGGAGVSNTNTGTDVFMIASSQISSTNNLWLQVQRTNTTVSLVIHPPWNVTDGVYDLFYTTNLAPTSTWTCVMRCTPGQTNLTVTGLTGTHGFFMLGLTNDTDGDGLTDAYEKLVSHTDPNVFNLAILSQPQSQTVIQGSNATFSVTAAGVLPLSYQWYFNSTPLTGAINAILTLNNVQTTNAGNYYVVVTNSLGSLTSSVATLTVNFPFTNLPYGASGYRYLIVTNTSQSTNYYTSFYTTNFVDTNFINGQAAFGTNDGTHSSCGLYPNYKTYWKTNTDLLLRRFFYVPPGTTNLNLGLAIDNDAQIYLNGILITNAARVLTNGISTTNAFTKGGWFMHEGCAANDSLLLESISNSVWSAGTNLLAVHGRDRGVVTYADVQISCRLTYATTNQPPTVQIIFPTNNALLNSGAPITITAVAYDLDGSVTNVQFFNGTNLLATPIGVGTNYTFPWTNAPLGTNILTAVATDNDGLTQTSTPPTVVIINNPTPVLTVSFLDPTKNQLFVTSPLNILLTAATSDSSGTITNVQFFNVTNLPGNVTVASSNMWTLLWTDVVAGSYSLTVKASDDAGNTATNGVSITVNAMPVVYITQPTNAIPTNFQSFLQTTNVTLSASASDSDGFIARVQFYYFTNLWGTFTNTGTNGLYNFTTNNLPPGFYPITATATDNRGAVSWSRIEIFKVISTNVPPAVAITYPTNGATFAAGCDLTITATAAASTNAAITNVEFFANGVSLGNDPASPYSMTRCCWSSGTNQLVARATDNRGMSTVSDPVQIVVLGETPTADGFWDPTFWNFTSGQQNLCQVTAMTVHGTDLYVGMNGIMTTNKCTEAVTRFISIAKWDGTNWATVGDGGSGVLNGGEIFTPYAIAVEGTNIYLGGGPVGPGNNIIFLKLVGTNWVLNPFLGLVPTDYDADVYGYGYVSGYGYGSDAYEGEVDALAVVGSDVYVGGDFMRWTTNIYGMVCVLDTNVVYIAKLNPATSDWERVGNGLNGPVFALASIGNKLFAGGTFTAAGGNTNVNYIAELDGNVWTNLGTGVGGLNSSGSNGAVYALAACGSNLFVGGDFTTAGGNTNANGIARWDGKQWTTLQGGLAGGDIYFGRTGIADGSFVRSYPINGMRVLSISARGNTLFVGGDFTQASQGTGRVHVNHIAKAVWSEQSQTWTWSDLDQGLNPSSGSLVTATAIMEGPTPGSYDLFVGGYFDNAGSAQMPSYDLARWSVGRPYPAGPPTVIITNPISPAIVYNPYQTITTNYNDYPRISFETNFDHTTNISIIATAWSYTNILTVKLYTNDQLLASVPGLHTNGYIVVTKVWTNPPGGLYLLKAVAVDTNMVASKPSQPVLVEVKNPTNSITAVDDVYTIPANSPPVTFYVLTNDISPTSLKISQITKLHNYLGSATVSFGGAYIRYTPFPNVYGIDTIYYTVTNADGALDTASVTVNILPLPQVNIVSPWDGQRFTNLATSLVVTGWVASANTDTNASVTNVTLNVIDANGMLSASQTPINGGFSFNWMNSTSGFYTFVAVTTDGNGYTNSSPAVTIALCNSNAPSHTVTAVISNLNSTVSSQCGLESETNPVIRDGLFDLQGRAADSIATNPVAYQVLLFQPDPDAGMTDGDPAIEYLGDIPFANLTPGPLNGQDYHNGRDVNGALGRLDLTGIPDGVYVIMLKVRGGPDETNTLVQVQINSQLKIGQFSFSEQDLVLPVNGIPITITRTYNSQNPRSSDFGSCWTYAMNSMDVQLDEQRQNKMIGGDVVSCSDDAGYYTPFQVVNIRTGGNRDVTLTLPNGQRVTFAFTPYLGPTEGQALWKAPAWIHATLETIGDPEIDYYPQPPFWKEGGAGSDFNTHDVPGWWLTTQPDGTKYKITRGPVNTVYYDPDRDEHFVCVQVYGPPKLTEIHQRSGDVIKIGDNGITNYSGSNPTRSVTFDRDYAGRITAVYDPISLLSHSGATAGQPAVRYIYDRDNDNLIQVLKLVDRNAGTYTTNQYHYDNPYFPHFITSIENGNGVPVARNYYDDSGKLIAVQDANGNLTQFIHNTANNMEVVIDQLGYGSTNYYDSRGNVTTTVNALGQTNRFAFDNNNYLLVSVDPLGHTNSYGYDGYGCRIASTNALGQATHFNFDGNGQLLSKTDALMNATSFGYDSAGHRTKVTDALGNPTTFGHDVYGRPNAVTNALSQLRATAGSDSSGNLQFVSQVGGLQMNFGHDLNGNTTNTSFAWVNPVNSQTQTLSTITELDAANRVTRVTDPDGQSRMTIYDPAGRVAQSIDRMGNTNSYVYDALGNVIQTTYADGSVTRNVYDARSQVLYSDDRHLPGAAANGSHNVYDPLGRVIRSERLANVQIDVASSGSMGQSVFKSADAVLSASSTAYDAAGRVLATTNALGYITRFEYDAAGRQTAVIDALTNRMDSVYDAAGQLRFTTNALKQVTEYQYDPKGRRIKTIFPDTSYTTNSYNEIGQLMFVKDQAGLETDYQYDSLGRMTNVTKPQVFNPEGGANANPQWAYQYDSYGNILDIRDPKGRETKFTYDAFGQLVSRTLPLLQTNFNAYNALGQLAMSVDFLGQSNCFVYDSLGRVATNFLYTAGASAPSQTNVFVYDANGRLYQTLRPEGITTFQYNLDGAVTNITSPEGTISYEYDPTMGWLTRAYTTNSDIRYSYDELSRLKTVSVVKRDGATLATPEVTTNTYTRLGSLQNVFFPNGTWTVYQYDVMNRLTNVVNFNSTNGILSRYQYTLGSNGLRQAVTESRLESNGAYSTNQIAYTYDNLGRLIKEASVSLLAEANYTNNYVYDLAGNLLWRTNGASGEVIAYSYNANDQLLQESSTINGVVTNRYDANGSLTNRSSASEASVYSYNLEGRLATAAVKRLEGSQWVQQTNRYFYNQSGIRTREEMSGTVAGTNIFLNDPQNLTGFNQVLEKLSAVGGTPMVTYTIGNRVLSQSKSSTVSHLLSDGHGSTRLLTGSTGSITDRYSYDAYGKTLGYNPGTLNPPATAILYSGEQLDADLQQYYLRSRYYNPAVGRFGVADQLDGIPTDPLSLHKYTYTHNNPVNNIDPSGNETMVELSFAMSIGTGLQLGYEAGMGYIEHKLQEEGLAAGESIEQIEEQDASPDKDTATIIVHGVEGVDIGGGHTNGWSKPFQNNLRLNNGLNHDFYEFDWGGFGLGPGLGFVPVKSVHQMAFIHLQTAQMLIWMKGYDKINVISHSWGTCLAYDLLNSGGIEMSDWVTMGSPLNHGITKPVWNTGKWINFYSTRDPVTHFDMYPQPFLPPQWSDDAFNPPQVDDYKDVTTPGSGYPLSEHTAYWSYKLKPLVIDTIREDLQH